MIEAELRSALQQGGLQRVAGDLMALSAPTIRVRIAPRPEEEIPVGASKVGGLPDLPVGIDWPSWHEPMAFLGQFNLREIASHDVEDVLPPHGLLSFFWETDGEPLYAARWGLPEDAPYQERYPDLQRSWKVLYHAEEQDVLVRRELPRALNPLARFRACAASFAAEVTLPDVDGPRITPLGLTSREREALIDLDVDINRGSWEEGGHHLLGYPYNIATPTVIECDMAHRGISWEAWAKATRAQQLEVARDVSRRWRLLLQIDSNDDAEMDWAGGGLVHYCIEGKALAERDFSRTWLNIQLL